MISSLYSISAYRTAESAPHTVITRIATFWEQRCERFRQRQALAALDERILNDIGLTRADVEYELHRPSWKD